MIKSSKALWTGLFLTAPFFLSCAHNEDLIKSQLDVWLQKQPDKLVEAWGAPDSNYTMDNGSRVLSYNSEKVQSRTTGLAGSPYRFGNYTYSESCKINFYTDPVKKTITRYTTSGEDYACVDAIRDYSGQK